MNSIELLAYQKEIGKVPLYDWLNSLDKTTFRIVMTRLARIRVGNLGDCSPIGDGIWEFRIDFGPGYRIYYAKLANQLVILFIGGNKRSQSRDINKAKEYWLDYKENPDVKSSTF